MKKIILILILFSLYVNSYANDIKYVTTIKGLRVRSSSELKSKIIETIKYSQKAIVLKRKSGEDIFIAGRYGQWIFVDTGKNKGWVFDGFLCDFNPESAKKYFKNYYYNFYKEDWKKSTFGGKPQIFEYPKERIRIDNIIKNYILLEVPTDTIRDSYNDHKEKILWKYEPVSKKFVNEYRCYTPATKLLYINNDKYPDLIVNGGLSELDPLSIIFGMKSGFSKKNQEVTINNCVERFIKNKSTRSYNRYGKCSMTRLSCFDYETNLHNIYQFDCKTNKLKIIKSKKVD